eukprot:gene7468-8737_t
MKGITNLAPKRLKVLLLGSSGYKTYAGIPTPVKITTTLDHSHIRFTPNELNDVQTTRVTARKDEWSDVSRTCIVLFPFNASHKFQLPLSVGDLVQVHAQTASEGDQGWYSGVSLTTQESGIFPQSYVVILPDSLDDIAMPHHVPIASRLNIANEEMANSALFNELTATIVEWATLLKIFSQNKQHNDFRALTYRITSLVQFRNQLLGLVSPKDISFDLRDRIIHAIDDGRQETGMTIILRKEISNVYSSASVAANHRNSAMLTSGIATDLILADAENTGVFTLCTMYQEKKYSMADQHNKTLESAKRDDQSSSGVLVGSGGLSGSTVTSQSPSSLGSSPANGSQLSSLNLNSPILSNTSSRRPPQPSLLKSHHQSSSPSLNKPPRGGSFLGSSTGIGAPASTANPSNDPNFVKPMSQIMSENRFVSENYSGVIPPVGIFVEPDNVNEKIRTIFKDLEAKDLSLDLYLVARIYRRTNSTSSKDPNSSPTLSKSGMVAPPPASLTGSSGSIGQQAGASANKLFRKYIGCGVKRLDLSANDSTTELLITLFTSTTESNMHSLHEQIAASDTSSSLGAQPTYEPIVRAKGIVCTVRHFHGDYAAFLVEQPDARSIAPSLKMALPEVVLPGHDRNDMYITIEEGDFADKNVEVTLMVRTDSGVVLTDAIKASNGAGGELPEYHTTLQGGSTTSCRWSETIKVWMSAKSFEKSHLFFLVRQCQDVSSGKRDARERQTLAYGYLRMISDDGAVLRDASHNITLHRATSDELPPISLYINGVVDTSKSSSKRNSDILKVRTHFVSTCLTQNPLVVNLSRWQSFPGDLSSLIKDITFLGQQELIRNLQEIFYNFLAILDQQLNDSPLSMEIFRAFIFIVGVLVDSRTTNYRPALDVYVSRYFGVPMGSSNQPQVGISAHTHLLRAVVKNLENFQDPANASRISSSLKALEYIFKMVVASRTKFPSKESSVAHESYQSNLKNVVDILCDIMISSSPSLIGAQTIALKNFEGMFADLKRFFTLEEMGVIAVKFMKSIQHLEKNRTFNILKLRLLASYLHGQLMLNKETRKQLHPIVFHLLQFHFGKSIEETDMCLTILGLIVDIMITKSEMRGKDKDAWLMNMMSFFAQILELLQLIHAHMAMNRRSSSSANLNGASASITLASMVASMTEENQYDLRLKIYAFILGTARLAGVQHWEMFSRSVTSKTFFVDLYDCLQHLFDSPRFPTDFWTLTVFKLKTILRMTRILEDVTFYVSPTTTTKEIGESATPSTIISNGGKVISQFEFSLWRSFFLMTSSYLNCKDLQFESAINPAKAVFLKSRCGDVRIEMARVLERSDTMDAKRVATKIYYDMLESEISQTGGYQELMSRTVDSLLECGTGVSDGMNWPTVCRNGDKLPFTARTFAAFFNVACMQLVLGKATEETRKKAETFISDITNFISLLSTFMDDVKRADEEETFSSVSKLIGYLSDNKRTAQFIRFLHMCSKRHFSNGNYIEAAVAVMMHASLYAWDHTKIINSINNEYGSFPVQKESERKEILYKEILACYNKAKAWDRAIPLLKELIHHFTMNICDMNAAATYLRQQGTFYQKINDSDPIFEEYFRVGYYGKRFPVSIQNKEFIYKGNEFERLSDFISKTCDKWPKAELLKSTETPSQSIMDSDTQFNVSNINDIQKRASLDNYVASKKRIPLRVQQLNARSKVNVFLYSKPFKKPVANGIKKSANEFEDLWLMNLYLVCDTTFPCTQRRALVVSRQQVEVSPIENALNSVVQKNEELLARIDKYQQQTPPDNINPLTMTLNGIIDASVNGGVSRYELFLTEDYLKQHPSNKHLAEFLKVAMDQQIVVLEQALRLHCTLRPESMAALQEKLESIFNTMKAERSKYSTFV